MIVPDALVLHRYRAFAGTETLPLRPLTLLYGRNNSGKSALVRALSLLGASVARDAGAAVVLPREAFREARFTDLAWQGDAGDYSFDLALRWNTGNIREARYTVDGGMSRPSYVKELSILGPDNSTSWSGVAAPGRPMSSATGREEIQFVGLVPVESNVPALQDLAERLSSLRGRIRWLDGVRAHPPREIEKSSEARPELLADGANVGELLLRAPELIHDAGAFYRALDPPRELEVKEELGTKYRIRLNPMDRPAFRIDLIDTGEGMSQVLPVLVAASMCAREGRGSILAVEEAESHLHPDAQTVLAEYLCARIARSDPPIIVLETHSRVFLLAVQLAVARGLPPELISLVWIDQDKSGRSTITPVELGPSGHPKAGWPAQALGEDLRIAGELAKLGLSRSAGDAVSSGN